MKNKENLSSVYSLEKYIRPKQLKCIKQLNMDFKPPNFILCVITRDHLLLSLKPMLIIYSEDLLLSVGTKVVSTKLILVPSYIQ